MEKATSLLFDLDGFRVVSVTKLADGSRVVLVGGTAVEQACPACGVLDGRVHARWAQRITDLP